jgi:hypothetical protein
MPQHDAKSPSYALKRRIFRHIEQSQMPQDNEMYIRARFCGGKFDVTKLIAKGFCIRASEKQGDTLCYFAQEDSTMHELRIHVGPTGYLRDVL